MQRLMAITYKTIAESEILTIQKMIKRNKNKLECLILVGADLQYAN